jgi:hypothetical protein
MRIAFSSPIIFILVAFLSSDPAIGGVLLLKSSADAEVYVANDKRNYLVGKHAVISVASAAKISLGQGKTFKAWTYHASVASCDGRRVLTPPLFFTFIDEETPEKVISAGVEKVRMQPIPLVTWNEDTSSDDKELRSLLNPYIQQICSAAAREPNNRYLPLTGDDSKGDLYSLITGRMSVESEYLTTWVRISKYTIGKKQIDVGSTVMEHDTTDLTGAWSLVRWAINCRRKSSILLSVYQYDASGTNVDGFDRAIDASLATPWVPNTIGERQFSIICQIYGR